MLCLLSFVRIENKLKQRTEKGSAAGNPPCRQANIKCGTLLREVFRIAVLFLRDRD